MKFTTLATVGAMVFSGIAIAKPHPMSYLNNTTALENDPPQPDPDKCLTSFYHCPPQNPEACCSCRCIFTLYTGYICSGDKLGTCVDE